MSEEAVPKEQVPEPTVLEPERGIARDIVRRGLYVAPVWLLITGLIWGIGGAASSAYGLALVLANIWAAAAIITHAARISPTALMGAVMGGFIVRLALLAGAVFAVSWLSLFEPVPLAITILVSHLGLLVVEARYVSLALAQPGLVQRGDTAAKQTAVQQTGSPNRVSAKATQQRQANNQE